MEKGQELNVPIRRVARVEGGVDAEDAPQIKRPPVPEHLRHFPKQVRYRWLKLQRSFGYWDAQRQGKPTAKQLAFFQRYGLLELAREAGFVITESKTTTLDQFLVPSQT